MGSVLANILGQYDIKTVLLDRVTSAYQLPRAVMFDDEIMRIFQSLGLSKKMQEIEFLLWLLLAAANPAHLLVIFCPILVCPKK